MAIRWSDNADEVQDLLNKGYTNAQLAKHFNVAVKTIKNRLPEMEREGLIKRPTDRMRVQQEAMGKHTLDRNADGSYTSVRDKLWLRNDMIYDDDYILTQHGFNPADWEIVTVRHNQWENYSKKDGITELFASRVTVKPKTQRWTPGDLVAVIKADVKPIYVATDEVYEREEHLLEVPFFDQHFGVSNLKDYEQTLSRTVTLIDSKHWEQILLIIGQDLLHNNDFRGHTANGTQIEVVDIPRAWNDAALFYAPIIETSLSKSKRVKVMYAKANHDEALAWSFVQYLKARYPQCEFDDEVQERKAHTFGKVFIGVTHGDKAKKNLHNIFPVEFPIEWSQATVRELHSGHYHVEDAKDTFGMMVRTLATRNKTDQWHKDNGFVGAHKRFQLFEYSTDELLSIHYV